MRIVIVEDEPKTRNGLIKIIEKYTSHEVVASECDGIKGLETICRLKPDALITDINMPNMDGLTMLEKLREMQMDVCTVLLTGYSEFEYAKKAIRLEAIEYLLKPLNVEDILLVLEHINQRKTKAKTQSVSEEQLLFSLLTCDEEERSLWEHQLAEKLLLQKGVPAHLFLIKTVSVLTETINEVISVLQDCLHTICLTGYQVLRLPIERTLLVVITDGQSVHYLKELFQMKVVPEINSVGKCLVCYGKVHHVFELRGKLADMQELFDYSFVAEEGRIVEEETVKEFPFEEINYPDALEQGMKKEIRSGNIENIKKIAVKFQKNVMESNAVPKCVKEYTIRFLLAALDVVRDLKRDKEVELLYRHLLNHLMECSTRENLLYEYWKMIHTFFRSSNEHIDTENGMVLNVIEFIRNNYNKDISLSEAAERVGITPEYLSKLFTKEMGINFSTFLGNFRVSAAKRLLAENQYKIYEVSEIVGYHDTKYFNKVFKSIVGISPSEFRRVKGIQ